MQEDLVILLEWLNANGIDDLFSNEIETKKDIMEALAEKQDELATSSFNKFNEIKNQIDNINSLDSLLDFVKTSSFYDKFRKLSNNSLVVDGNLTSKILIINDIPNDQDDISGKIFSGNDGVLLRNMFASVNIDNYCLMNTFFWRLPGNRNPIKEELEICKPVVEKAISLIEPKLIILTGNYSTSILIENNKTLSHIKNKIVDYTNCYITKNIKVTGIYNPNFIIKNVSKKKEIWETLLKIRTI